MAQKTQIILTDDVDGSEAAQTITFAFQGTSYEIDLSDEHAASIGESFEEWITHARKAPTRGAASGGAPRSSAPRGSSGTKRTDLDDVRTWARANGHTVADRGRIASKVLDAYDTSH